MTSLFHQPPVHSDRAAGGVSRRQVRSCFFPHIPMTERFGDMLKIAMMVDLELRSRRLERRELQHKYGEDDVPCAQSKIVRELHAAIAVPPDVESLHLDHQEEMYK